MVIWMIHYSVDYRETKVAFCEVSTVAFSLHILNKTKQNKTKQNKTKRNETKRNETKRNETKRNVTKRNETKRNETKQTKELLSNILVFMHYNLQ